jgi:hypothetical protein
VAKFTGRYSGCAALSVALCVVMPRSMSGTVESYLDRASVAPRLADGRMPARACSAWNRFASYCAFADCQVAS